MGIFFRIPNTKLRETWVLIQDSNSQFLQTGLKKTSLIRADKIATVSKLVFQRKLGYLPEGLSIKVRTALKNALNIT